MEEQGIHVTVNKLYKEVRAENGQAKIKLNPDPKIEHIVLDIGRGCLMRARVCIGGP